MVALCSASCRSRQCINSNQAIVACALDAIVPPESCSVDTIAEFLKTAQDIVRCSQSYNTGTVRAKDAMTTILNKIHVPEAGVSKFHHDTLFIASNLFSASMKEELLKLLDSLLPTSVYSIVCTIGFLLTQPLQRLHRQETKYIVRQRSASDLPLSSLTLATNLKIVVEGSMKRVLLEVLVTKALSNETPCPHGADIRLILNSKLPTKFCAGFLRRITREIRASRFRGTISAEFKSNANVLEPSIKPGGRRFVGLEGSACVLQLQRAALRIIIT